MSGRHSIETEVQSQWPESITIPEICELWGGHWTSKGHGMGE